MGVSGRYADETAVEELSEEIGCSVIIGSRSRNADDKGTGCGKGIDCSEVTLPEVVARNIVLGSSGK